VQRLLIRRILKSRPSLDPFVLLPQGQTHPGLPCRQVQQGGRGRGRGVGGGQGAWRLSAISYRLWAMGYRLSADAAPTNVNRQSAIVNRQPAPPQTPHVALPLRNHPCPSRCRSIRPPSWS
jgi:hypothetical protein